MTEPHLLPFVRSWTGKKGISHRRLLLTGAVLADSGCWEWRRARTPHGYGVLNLSVDGRQRTFFAHRLSYSTFVRAIDADLTIDHLCRNRACIRPSHLEQVTLLENQRRNGRNYRSSVVQLALDVTEPDPQPQLFEVIS